jgi:hypothetical protein
LGIDVGRQHHLFHPFFFVLNPALVLQGAKPVSRRARADGAGGFGTLFICGGIQGYQAFVGDLRAPALLEWPLRVCW